MPETKAGSKSGARLMGLSLSRGGDPMIEATGKPAPAGGKPTTTHKGAKFSGGAMARGGDNTIACTGRPGAAGQAPVTKY